MLRACLAFILIINHVQTNHGEVRSNGGDTQALKTSAALTQVWKDELNSGRTLVSLFELFGEGILSFIQAPEMYMFL